MAAANTNPSAAITPAHRAAPRTAIGTISLTTTTIMAPAATDSTTAMNRSEAFTRTW